MSWLRDWLGRFRSRLRNEIVPLSRSWDFGNNNPPLQRNRIYHIHYVNPDWKLQWNQLRNWGYVQFSTKERTKFSTHVSWLQILILLYSQATKSPWLSSTNSNPHLVPGVTTRDDPRSILRQSECYQFATLGSAWILWWNSNLSAKIQTILQTLWAVKVTSMAILLYFSKCLYL